MRPFQFAFFLVIVICFTNASPSHAQGNGLTITGSVIDLKRSTDSRLTNDGEALWNLDLLLTLRNNGTKTILLLDCFSGGCNEKAEFSREIIASDDTGSQVSDKIFFTYTQDSGWGVNVLNTPQPSSQILVLSPGQMIERRNAIAMRQKFSPGPKGSTVWQNVDKADGDFSAETFPITMASKIRVRFTFQPMEAIPNCYDRDFSLKEHTKNKCERPYHDKEFLSDLRRRWKPMGDFPVTSDGLFIMTSDLIVNLPKSPEEFK